MISPNDKIEAAPITFLRSIFSASINYIFLKLIINHNGINIYTLNTFHNNRCLNTFFSYHKFKILSSDI